MHTFSSDIIDDISDDIINVDVKPYRCLLIIQPPSAEQYQFSHCHIVTSLLTSVMMSSGPVFFPGWRGYVPPFPRIAKALGKY